MPILSQQLHGFLESAGRMKGVSLLEHYAIPARHREQVSIPFGLRGVGGQGAVGARFTAGRKRDEQ
jgi:hypothetical protein